MCFGLAYRKRKGQFEVSFEAVGDETSGVVENNLLGFHHGFAVA